MPQIINTNMASLNAQRNLNRTQEQNQTALQRLSSGLRINSAKDDAAGMAISTRFTSQIRGLNQAVRNAGDGIALAQTAEGALGSMTENLQRIKELAVQSANASNSTIDREKLQKEVKQLIAEIGRTADETNFNGRKLLDGSFKDALFQVGANAGETIDISIAALTADKLGASAAAGVSAAGTLDALSNGDLSINGKLIGPSQGGADTASQALVESSAIAKVAAINAKKDETGVEAKVNVNEVNGSTMSSTGGGTTASVYINEVKFTFTAQTNNDDVTRKGTRSAVVDAINAKSEETGVVAVDGGDKNGVILQAKDGRNISLRLTVANASVNLKDAFGLAAATTVAAATDITATTGGVYTGGLTLTAVGDTKSIEISGGYGTGSGDLSHSGFTRGSYQKGEATYTTKTTAVSAGVADTAGTAARLKGIQSGDLVINGTTIGASRTEDDQASNTTAHSSNKAASGIAQAAAINRASDKTGVSAEVQETTVSGGTKTSVAAAEGVKLNIFINGRSIGGVVSQGDIQKDRNSVIDAINAKSGDTGVVATDNGESVTLTAADGRNISVAVGGTTAGAAANDALSKKFGLSTEGDNNGIGIATAADAFATGAETTYASVRLTSAKTIDIEAGEAGTTGLKDSGYARGEYGNGKNGQFLKDVDITTVEGANKALNAIENALETVSNARSDLGAIQNRMSSTVSNLRVNAENLTSARSRIMDTDFAAQTAELSRTSVLQQAGISILAQANASGQNVLSLLG